jgi:anti-anti-sigma factor
VVSFFIRLHQASSGFIKRTRPSEVSTSRYALPMSSVPQSEPMVIVLVALEPELRGFHEDPALLPLLKQPPGAPIGVVVDATRLAIMSSPGLAQLVMLRRRLQCQAGRIRIAGANSDIERMIRVCHLDEFFGIDATVTDAVEALRAPIDKASHD